MRDLLSRVGRPGLAAFALAAAAGWGSFAYLGMASNARTSALAAERDTAVAELQHLQDTAGQLSQLEGKIGSARVEYGRVVQAWADARDKLGAAQATLAQVAKRQDSAGDRVTQTGSIRPVEPPKRPSR